MDSNTDERIDEIVNGLAQVLKVAITHQETASASVNSLDALLRNLSQKIQALEDQVRNEIQSSVNNEIEQPLRNASNEVFQELLNKFETANKNAIEAADTYRQATEQCAKTMNCSTWRVCALAASVSGLLAIILTAIAINNWIPWLFANKTRADLLSLSQIIECSDGKRLCVRVDEKTKADKNGYRYVLMKKK
jgi:flagellar biosynthesis chaperone FliJ